jgi:hypothetical protein
MIALHLDRNALALSHLVRAIARTANWKKFGKLTYYLHSPVNLRSHANISLETENIIQRSERTDCPPNRVRPGNEFSRPITARSAKHVGPFLSYR